MAKAQMRIVFGADARGYMRTLGKVKASTANVVRGLAAIGAGGAIFSIREATRFSKGMAEVNTIAKLGAKDFAKLKGGVRAVMTDLGMGLEDAIKGTYDAFSAGVPADNVLEFLRTAGMAAVGGVTDAATAVDGMTTILDAFALSSKDAGRVSDVLFGIVENGKITYSELAAHIGKVAPTADSAGLSLEEFAGYLARLTQIAKPEQAMTNLSAAMRYAADQGKPLARILKEFEGASLEELRGASVGDEAARGIAILAKNLKATREQLKLAKNTAGGAQRAFDTMAADPSHQFALLVAQIRDIGIEIGGPLMVALAGAAEQFRELAGNKENMEALAQAAVQIADALVVAMNAAAKLWGWMNKFADWNSARMEKRPDVIEARAAYGRSVNEQEAAAARRLHARGIKVGSPGYRDAMTKETLGTLRGILVELQGGGKTQGLGLET